MPKWLIVVLDLVAVAAWIPDVRNAVINWLKAHPVVIGPALTLAAIVAVLCVFSDPVSVVFLAVIAIVAGFAALLDPKTYSRKPPA